MWTVVEVPVCLLFIYIIVVPFFVCFNQIRNAHCLQRADGSAHTYRYGIMVKGNPHWLRQISNNLVLHSDVHHITDNPVLFVTLLKLTQTHESLASLTLWTQHHVFSRSISRNRAWTQTGRCVGSCWHLFSAACIDWRQTKPHLEEVVVSEESTHDCAWVFGSLF